MRQGTGQGQTGTRLTRGRKKKVTRDELFEHMLSDPYHSGGRKQYLRELRDKGAWYAQNQPLREGTIRAKAMHASDHSHPNHEH